MTSQLPQAQQQLAEAQGTEGTHTLNEMFCGITWLAAAFLSKVFSEL